MHVGVRGRARHVVAGMRSVSERCGAGERAAGSRGAEVERVQRRRRPPPHGHADRLADDAGGALIADEGGARPRAAAAGRQVVRRCARPRRRRPPRRRDRPRRRRQPRMTSQVPAAPGDVEPGDAGRCHGGSRQGTCATRGPGGPPRAEVGPSGSVTSAVSRFPAWPRRAARCPHPLGARTPSGPVSVAQMSAISSVRSARPSPGRRRPPQVPASAASSAPARVSDRDSAPPPTAREHPYAGRPLPGRPAAGAGPCWLRRTEIAKMGP